MKETTQGFLMIAIQRLEAAAAEIAKQKNALQKRDAVKVLLEVAREQVKNENTRPSTR